jgi:hypothetical protein
VNNPAEYNAPVVSPTVADAPVPAKFFRTRKHPLIVNVPRIENAMAVQAREALPPLPVEVPHDGVPRAATTAEITSCHPFVAAVVEIFAAVFVLAGGVV